MSFESSAVSIGAGAEASPSGGRRRWAEFMLVGGLTFVLLPTSWLAQRLLGLDAAELGAGFLTFHAAVVINDPHFSVTYLLFYRGFARCAFGKELSGVQRVRYWVAGIGVPLGLAAWAGGAIGGDSAQQLGLMIQLMFALVGWHYVKQAFGVLLFSSARSGVYFRAPERRALLLHCLAAWLYAWSSPARPATAKLLHGVLYTSIAQPSWLATLSLGIFLASCVHLGSALLQRERRGEPRALLPLLAFGGSVWIWTVFSRLDSVFYYFIPALHSVQYLYFVHRLARGEAAELAGPPHFQGTIAIRLGVLGVSAVGLGWLLLHGMPSWLDSVLVLGAAQDRAEMASVGPTPYLAAFTTFVNIHHYFMDWVIWRRENPLTRYLSSRD